MKVTESMPKYEIVRESIVGKSSKNRILRGKHKSLFNHVIDFTLTKYFLGDEIEERPNTLKLIPEEGSLLNLSFASSSEMYTWIQYLEAAKKFQVIIYKVTNINGSHLVLLFSLYRTVY